MPSFSGFYNPCYICTYDPSCCCPITTSFKCVTGFTLPLSIVEFIAAAWIFILTIITGNIVYILVVGFILILATVRLFIVLKFVYLFVRGAQGNTGGAICICVTSGLLILILNFVLFQIAIICLAKISGPPSTKVAEVEDEDLWLLDIFILVIILDLLFNLFYGCCVGTHYMEYVKSQDERAGAAALSDWSKRDNAKWRKDAPEAADEGHAQAQDV